MHIALSMMAQLKVLFSFLLAAIKQALLISAVLFQGQI